MRAARCVHARIRVAPVAARVVCCTPTIIRAARASSFVEGNERGKKRSEVRGRGKCIGGCKKCRKYKAEGLRREWFDWFGDYRVGSEMRCVFFR